MQTGAFTNAANTYYAAPQQLNNAGQIIGHNHVVIEEIPSLDSTQPTNPRVFAFFKGLNNAAANGQLTADVTNGLPAGTYRLSSISSAANHQSVVMPVAQRGAVDDAVYVRVFSCYFAVFLTFDRTLSLPLVVMTTMVATTMATAATTAMAMAATTTATAMAATTTATVRMTVITIRTAAGAVGMVAATRGVSSRGSKLLMFSPAHLSFSETPCAILSLFVPCFPNCSAHH